MYAVTCVKGGLVNRYGVYPTRQEADEIAALHRSTGYWASVDVTLQTAEGR